MSMHVVIRRSDCIYHFCEGHDANQHATFGEAAHITGRGFNYARPFIYTTSLRNATITTTSYSFDFLEDGTAERLAMQVLEHSTYLQEYLPASLAASSILAQSSAWRPALSLFTSSRTDLTHIYQLPKGTDRYARRIDTSGIEDGDGEDKRTTEARDGDDNLDAFEVPFKPLSSSPTLRFVRKSVLLHTITPSHRYRSLASTPDP
ncbi:hypothetical protein DFH94DRAFT_699325 [Russula ochroleuca]|uniref:Uncharacterized protein n=1 Tax=Russula ochroleuca TaxID=152965 RepID=A0A9P5JVA4_9AGAM|nr:hypothetical protein DFH94DRAFT_699325 [Russula ochroleuca]